MLFDKSEINNILIEAGLSPLFEKNFDIKFDNKIIKLYLSPCDIEKFDINENIFDISSHHEVRCKVIINSEMIPVIMTDKLHCCEPYTDKKVNNKYLKSALTLIRVNYSNIIIAMYEMGIKGTNITTSILNNTFRQNDIIEELPDTPYDILIEYDPENADKLRKIKETHIK